MFYKTNNIFVSFFKNWRTLLASDLYHLQKADAWCFARLSTKICFLVCFASLAWNHLCLRWQTMLIIYFSVLVNFAVCLFRFFFSLAQFCFHEYLSFLFNFYATLLWFVTHFEGHLEIDILISALTLQWHFIFP